MGRNKNNAKENHTHTLNLTESNPENVVTSKTETVSASGDLFGIDATNVVPPVITKKDVENFVDANFTTNEQTVDADRIAEAQLEAQRLLEENEKKAEQDKLDAEKFEKDNAFVPPPKIDHPIPDFNRQEANAILHAAAHVDIYDQPIAIEIRRMTQKIPQYKRFFDIVKSKTKATESTPAPYFACNVTELGLELAQKYQEAKNKKSLSSITV